MALTNTIYDPKAYETAFRESVSVFPYVTDPVYSQRSKYCHCDQPTNCSCVKVGQNNQVTPFEPFHRTPSIIDAESDVQNRSRKYSKDPTTQYPYNGAKAPHTLEAEGEVGLYFSNQNTRVQYPQPNRGNYSYYPERFYNTQIDIQSTKNIDDNTKIGLMTYLGERDSFKAYIPRPYEDKSLPTPENKGEIPFHPKNQTNMYYGDPTRFAK